MNHRQEDHGGGVCDEAFVVGAEAAILHEPSDGSFNEPAFWERVKVVDLGSFDDVKVQAATGADVGDVTNEFAGVASVGPDEAKAAVERGGVANQRQCGLTILHGGRAYLQGDVLLFL